MVFNPLVFIPGLSAFLFIAFEMPHELKRVFLKIPPWISSSLIAWPIGILGRGVLGPMTMYMTELILLPGIWIVHKHFNWKEKKLEEKRKKHDK